VHHEEDRTPYAGLLRLRQVKDNLETEGGPITRVWQKIGLIAEISSACRKLRPGAPAYNEVLRLVQAIVPFDAATLYLRETVSDHFATRATLGQEVLPPEMLIQRDPVHVDRWHPRLQQPVVWSADDGAGTESDHAFAAVMLLPLSVDDRVIGLLNLGSYTPGVLAQRQLKLMAIVGDQLAVSIERLDHIAKIEAQNRELRKAQRHLQLSQEKRIAEEKLAAAAQLAASINHQINNPLSVVVGNIDCLIIEEPTLSSEARRRLDRVVSAALKIGEINRCLLNIQSIVAEETDPEPTAQMAERGTAVRP